MLDKILEQAQKAFQPDNDFVARSTKAFEEAAEKQKTFFEGIVSDNMAFVKELSAQKDFSGFCEIQKSYMQNIQDKITAASKEAYESLNSNKEQMSGFFKTATTA